VKIARVEGPEGGIRFAELLEDGRLETVEGDIAGGFRKTGKPLPPGKILAPIQPAQIICIGLNYRRHAEETGKELPDYPVVFMKTLNALCHPGDPVLLPTHQASKRVDYEVELAVVIGKAGKNIPEDEALDYVAGYTVANDVSARDWQKWGGGGQWVQAKSFDTFCPLGPVLVTPDEIPDPQGLQLTTEVNGEILQDSNTADMIFSVAKLISFLSGSRTLVPGTLILTGTPEGVGVARDPMRFLEPGDEMKLTIDKIGSLSNPVRQEENH
jgi:2-keto-4-pentenoate hydratase/2-oxohepta-3-ene-1,7-dioic acid hydratase in catechol pathway